MENKDLRDCYYSPTQLKLMVALGCKMKVSLNGKPVSQICIHKDPHSLLDDEEFVGTAELKDIDCIE